MTNSVTTPPSDDETTRSTILRRFSLMLETGQLTIRDHSILSDEVRLRRAVEAIHQRWDDEYLAVDGISYTNVNEQT